MAFKWDWECWAGGRKCCWNDQGILDDGDDCLFSLTLKDGEHEVYLKWLILLEAGWCLMGFLCPFSVSAFPIFFKWMCHCYILKKIINTIKANKGTEGKGNCKEPMNRIC